MESILPKKYESEFALKYKEIKLKQFVSLPPLTKTIKDDKDDESLDNEK